MASSDSTGAIVFCLGAVQFVNILDFMIVMPMGPDFATALGIPLAHLGYVGGSYTAAASISGLACAFFLDKFDRRSALVFCLVGLVFGTLGGAFATGLGSLLLARMVAGAFGGPATSLAYSIIADVIPPARRGRAMGAVMGAFSVASVLGVPAGLELARRGGFRLPFFAVSALGALIAIYTRLVLPSMTAHLTEVRSREHSVWTDFRRLFRTDVVLSLGMTACAMSASFIIIPTIAPYVIYNLGYPRARLGVLYLVGGLFSFAAMRSVGVLVDKFGSARVATVGTLFVSAVIYAGFTHQPPPLPVMGTFILFMIGMAVRNVAYNTLTTKVPEPRERARFSSIQSAVQHLASAVGAFASARLLTELPNHALAGVDTTAYVSVALGIALLPFLWAVESHVVAKAARLAAQSNA